MRRRTFIATGGVVAAGGAAAAAIGFGATSTGTPTRPAQPLKTADVTRTTLTDYEELDGELGYGEPIPLGYHAGGGIVTWLPAVGSTVDRGKPLFRVDNEPVAVLFGPLPMYRPLMLGREGPDVKQLEDNLRALGYTGFTADDRFTSATTAAVKRWQEDLGVPETGVVAPDQVLYTAGPVRVAEHKIRVGAPATGDIITYTGTVRKVVVALPVQQQRFAAVGGQVQVTLPGGNTATGQVEAVGAVASTTEGPQGQTAATLEVVVAIADQTALGTLQQGPVTVRFVAEERKDVLTVPVTALVALAEGGYGVQVVEGGTTRYVAVDTGMFASGRVELRGDHGLTPGTKVGVPG